MAGSELIAGFLSLSFCNHRDILEGSVFVKTDTESLHNLIRGRVLVTTKVVKVAGIPSMMKNLTYF
jgi:hypothetical protein